MLKNVFQWLAYCLITIMLLTGCSTTKASNTPYPDIPDNIYDFFVSYLEEAKDGFDRVVDYDYYPVEYEDRREAVRHGGEYVIDYQIIEVERINDDFYGCIFLIKTNFTLDKYEYQSCFVTHMDGKLYRIPNFYFVPEELSNKVDLTKYSPEAMNANIDPNDPNIISYTNVDEADIIG